MSKGAANTRLWSLRKKAGLLRSNDGDSNTIIEATKKRGRPEGNSKGRESKKQKLEKGDTDNVGGVDGDAESGGNAGNAGKSSVKDGHEK